MFAGSKLSYRCLNRQGYRCFSQEVKAFSRKKSPVVEVIPIDFKKQVDDLFKMVVTTLKPMLPGNPDFELTINANVEVRLKFGTSERSAYLFSPNYEEEVVRVVCPYSGSFEYYYDTETNNWLNLIDKHDLRGIVTRDLLKHCIGCPLFP